MYRSLLSACVTATTSVRDFCPGIRPRSSNKDSQEMLAGRPSDWWQRTAGPRGLVTHVTMRSEFCHSQIFSVEQILQHRLIKHSAILGDENDISNEENHGLL